MGCPIRTSADHCSYAAPRSLSQLYTSFIASVCLGIHRVPLTCLHYMACTHSRATHSYSCYWFTIVGRMGTNHIRLPWRSTLARERTNALLSFAAYRNMPHQTFYYCYCFHHVKEPALSRADRVWQLRCRTVFIVCEPGTIVLSYRSSHISKSQKTVWSYRDSNPGPLPCKGSALAS